MKKSRFGSPQDFFIPFLSNLKQSLISMVSRNGRLEVILFTTSLVTVSLPPLKFSFLKLSNLSESIEIMILHDVSHLSLNQLLY